MDPFVSAARFGELRVYGGTDPDTGKRRWVTRTVRGSRTEAQHELVALAQAVRWEWIWSNPAASASPPPDVPVEMRPPTPAELSRLFVRAAEVDPLFHLFLVLAATTGARRGQLLAPRWSDIDLRLGCIFLRRALVEGPEGPVPVPTKTRRCHRVALDPGGVALLEQVRARTRRRAWVRARVSRGGYFRTGGRLKMMIRLVIRPSRTPK